MWKEAIGCHIAESPLLGIHLPGQRRELFSAANTPHSSLASYPVAGSVYLKKVSDPLCTNCVGAWGFCVVVITLSWRQMCLSINIQVGCLQFHGPKLFLSGHQGHGPRVSPKVMAPGCPSVVKVMVPGRPPRSWPQAVPQWSSRS